MFKVMNGDKIVGVVFEWNAIDKKFHPDLKIVRDDVHEIEDYVMCEDQYLLRDDPTAIESEKKRVRGIRDSYLVEYVDPVVSNPLRWADMSEEERQKYSDYRHYLLDFTTQENWWESDPKTLEEWSE